MSDSSSQPPRPVSLATLMIMLGTFLVFVAVVRFLYRPASLAPENVAADNLPKELAWRATAETRRQALREMREKEAGQAAGYAWIDQKAGVVQLPIQRAMELTARHYGAKK